MDQIRQVEALGDAKHILLGRQTQSSSEQAGIPSEKQLGAAGAGGGEKRHKGEESR